MKDQVPFDKVSKFAARLAEERTRVCPHQGDFAGAIGVTQGVQSLLERGKRELRADYLETIARQGLDVAYIITGVRSFAALPKDASELVDSYLRMPADFQAALRVYAASMLAAIERIEGGGALMVPPPDRT